jgi:hypothetical protein
VFEADLEPDYQREDRGFYVIVLAENIDQAKVFIQAEFNKECELTVDVFKDVRITEMEGPFRAGKVLISITY